MLNKKKELPPLNAPRAPLPPAPSPMDVFSGGSSYQDVRSAVLGPPQLPESEDMEPQRAMRMIPPAPPAPRAPARLQEPSRRRQEEPEPPRPEEKLPPRPTTSLRAPLKMKGPQPPLFIKIDKYQDVLDKIQLLKTSSLTLRDALDAIADMEKELQTGLSLTHRALDRFNTLIAEIDAKMLGISTETKEEKMEKTKEEALRQDELGATEMDKYVKGLYEQMERIRSELKTIS